MGGLFPHLPLFLDLAGRRAVLLSGEAGMTAIARRLLDAGAGVTVAALEIAPELSALAPPVRLTRRRWRAADMDGAMLVIAGAREPRPAMARAAARAAGAVYAAPDGGEIGFGAAAAWGPAAIGVSAAGLPVGLAEAMALRFEAVVPAHYGAFLTAAARAEAKVAAQIPASDVRHAFWRATASAAFDSAPADWDVWIAQRLTIS